MPNFAVLSDANGRYRGALLVVAFLPVFLAGACFFAVFLVVVFLAGAVFLAAFLALAFFVAAFWSDRSAGACLVAVFLAAACGVAFLVFVPGECHRDAARSTATSLAFEGRRGRR